MEANLFESLLISGAYCNLKDHWLMFFIDGLNNFRIQGTILLQDNN